MALSFFRALNPLSADSGINYTHEFNYDCRGKEMIDYTFPEIVKEAFEKNFDYILALYATFTVIVGEHYDLSLNGKYDSKGGAKGLLDFLIFPLIARKLIANTYLPERANHVITNTLSWIIAIPLELARFTMGFVLSLLLAPVVALVHLLRDLSLSEEICDNQLVL